MIDFVPIYEYAKLHGVTEQTVYRKIREGRFKKEDVIKTKIEKTVFRINPEAEPTKDLNKIYYG